MQEISNKAKEVIHFSGTLHGLKDQAHIYFDKLWQNKYAERNEAYGYLARWLGVEEAQAHMSVMNEETCKKVIEFSIMMLNDFRRLDLDWGDPIQHPYYELKTN